MSGEVEPDMQAVAAAFATLMAHLGMDMEELARGIIRVANANMTNALRLMSTNKGYDPRDFALVAFGGGGAMHAVALAENLHIPHVIVPVNSAVFSAWGMLLTDRGSRWRCRRMRPADRSAAGAGCILSAADAGRKACKDADVPCLAYLAC